MNGTPFEGLPELLRSHRILLAGLIAVTLVALWPQVPTPVITAPGVRIALETSRFMITFATAGLLTGFAGGLGGMLRRGFIAALIVLGLTNLLFGVIPNVVTIGSATGSETLLPWVVARYLAGILFLLAGMERPAWSTRRLVSVTLVVYVIIEVVVILAGRPGLPMTLDDAGFVRPDLSQVVLELVPMGLFAAGAVLASRLYQRDQQPLERWLAAALLVGVFTQIHEAAFPVGLGPVVGTADLLRALSTVLLLVGAIQQVAQLRADRTRALALSHADLRELRVLSNRLQDYVGQEASFRSVVTHELSTPLATISAYAHVLDSTPLPDPAAQAARTIQREARRLQTLIQRMDELAEIDTDALAVEPRPVIIQPLLSEAAAFGRALPGNHAVSVRAEDEMLLLDPTRMSQVLRNVIGNAARYSPSGSPISVTGRITDGDYEILIADSGPGFVTGDPEPLFAKYRRGPHHRDIDGTGLGLWIAREIVSAHDGTIRVIEPDRPGGRVSIRLPLPTSLPS
ncbi:MAG: sensor histidine kinase [Euzebya sp.]